MSKALKRAFVLGLLLALFAALSVPASAATRTSMVNKVAAVVNGELITLFDLQRVAMPEIARLGLTGNDAQSEQTREAIFRQAMDSMIMDILIRQEADKYKISVTDQEVDNEVRVFIQRSQMTPQQFEQQLIIQGSNMEQFKKDMRNNILRQRMISVMVQRKIVVTREEIVEYYNLHKSEFTTQESVDLSIIVFAPNANPESVLQQLRAGRISFAEAAKKYSVAPNGPEGGNMGAIPWADLNTDWKQVLANMQSGQVSDVLSVNGTKLILQLNSNISGDSRSLEDVYAEIEQILREPRMAERFNEYAQQVRNNAVVDIRM